MAATFNWSINMYLNGAWVDVSADVRSSAPIALSRGINGTTVTDRVAKVGTLSFALDNSAANSAATMGYYSPDNASVRSGFEIGTLVRLFFYTDFSAITDESGVEITDESGNSLCVDGAYVKFHGKISDITPKAGIYGERSVLVMCVDYMNELLVHNMSKVAVQTGKRGDQLITTIVGNLPTAPLATSYATGTDTFSYALHDVQDEHTSGLNAAQRVCQSDLSYLFVTGNTSNGETLTGQARNTRFGLSSIATFTDTMRDMIVTRKSDNIYNNVDATGYPLKLGTTAEVLWTSQKEISIGKNQTLPVECNFSDPSGAGKRVAVIPGTEVTPVADTDYKMSSTPGGGNDKNAKLTISVTWGGNSATITLTNTDAATCYINTLQLRGKIIRLYDPLKIISKDTTSQAAYGDRVLSIAFPYQDSIHAITAFSTGLLSILKDPHSSIDSLEFIANVDDASMAKAMLCDVGKRITLSETVTGLTAEDVAINAYDLTIEAGKVTCKLGNLERRAVWNSIGTWSEDPPASGAAYDTVTNINGATTPAEFLSTTHTPVGTPTAIAFGLELSSSSAMPYVTYGGIPMNFVIKKEGSTSIYTYRLLSPPAGAQTIYAIWYKSSRYKAACVSITGALTYKSCSADDGSDSTAIVTVDSKANGFLVGFVACNGNVASISPQDTQITSLHAEVDYLFVAYTLTTSDGNDTISWTNPNSWSWFEAGMSFYTA